METEIAQQQEQQTQTNPANDIDPVKLENYLKTVKYKQNLGLAILGGIVAAIIGAAIWAGITVATDYQIGWMAIGVGFLVGYTVRAAGKGIDNIYGIIGATFSLLGCILGNLLTICIVSSRQEHIPFLNLFLALSPSLIIELLKATFSPMDLLFYGLAVYEGYKFSFRQITPEELSTLR